jgi:phosphoribosylformylglycinamidine cyclo-ligase
VFGWLAKAGGIAEAEMLRTFNCGVGMVVVCPRFEAERLSAFLREQGETASVIGEIAERGDGAPVRFSGSLLFS